MTGRIGDTRRAPRITEADYVIVGVDRAGCAMAYRLAEAGRDVLVIEHGGTDAGPFIQMPGALSYPMNMGRYDWGLRSEPEPNLGGRRLATPRGKVIGGSSSINGMVFVRGHAQDFDTWAEQGAQGWGYADVLPYFRRMETWHGGDGEEGKSGLAIGAQDAEAGILDLAEADRAPLERRDDRAQGGIGQRRVALQADAAEGDAAGDARPGGAGGFGRQQGGAELRRLDRRAALDGAGKRGRGLRRDRRRQRQGKDGGRSGQAWPATLIAGCITEVRHNLSLQAVVPKSMPGLLGRGGEW